MHAILLIEPHPLKHCACFLSNLKTIAYGFGKPTKKTLREPGIDHASIICCLCVPSAAFLSRVLFLQLVNGFPIVPQ